MLNPDLSSMKASLLFSNYVGSSISEGSFFPDYFVVATAHRFLI